MKKKYVKPEMFFEDFSLSTSIAGNCEYNGKEFNDVLPTADSVNSNCGLKFGQDAIFVDKVCKTPVDESDGFSASIGPEKILLSLYTRDGDTLCYHNPSEEFNIFNS